MEIEKMNFNYRIAMTKKMTFDILISNDELSEIVGTNETGYYPIREIMKGLNPAREKYYIDLELNVNKKSIIGIWRDGLSDNERIIEVDFSELENLGRLPSMKNDVQSKGAVLSYTRRYAYTVILDLPATDKIETQNIRQQKSNTYSNNSNTYSNKNNNNSNKNNKKEEYSNAGKKDDELKTIIKWVLLNINNKDNDKMTEHLEELTKFTKDNKEFNGVKSLDKLSPVRLKILYGKLKKEYKDLVEKMSIEYDKKLKELKNKEDHNKKVDEKKEDHNKKADEKKEDHNKKADEKKVAANV